MKITTLASSLLLLSSIAAQSVVKIDQAAHGCSRRGALLSDGNVARATASFAYDAVLAVLRVTVENNSPSNAGRPSPVITRIYFNAPPRAITSAVLVAQEGGGGGTPGFALGFDADAADADNPNRGDCFGFFNFRLASVGFVDGIANKDADTICTESKDVWVTGPVTFVIALAGPDVHGLTSESFAASTSRNATNRTVNLAMKFDGSNCTGFGTLGNGGDCRTAIFVRGTPTLGSTIGICIEGSNDCMAHLLAGPVQGPTVFPTFTAPIGMPIVVSLLLGQFTNGTTEFILPVTIPVDQALLGLTVHMTNMEQVPTAPLPRFSPAASVTVDGLLPQ